MIRQNVTSKNSCHQGLPFKLHVIDIKQAQPNANLTVSLHIEISPIHTTLGYALIYRFDRPPQQDSAINRTDECSLFCPSSQFSSILWTKAVLFCSDLTTDSVYQRPKPNRIFGNSTRFGSTESNRTESNRHFRNDDRIESNRTVVFGGPNLVEPNQVFQ